MKAFVSGKVVGIEKFFSKKKNKDIISVAIYAGGKEIISVYDYPEKDVPKEGTDVDLIPVNIVNTKNGLFCLADRKGVVL